MPISPDDVAVAVRNLRNEGLSASSVVIVLGVTNRADRYAARSLGRGNESRVIDASF